MTGWRTEELTRAALIDLPRTPLDHVREGRLIKVVGRIELLDPLHSPLGRRPCAAYSVKLQEKAAAFDSLVRVVESASRDFVLRDGKSFVLVRAGNASIFWERDAEGHWQDRATPEMRALLQKHELPGRDWVGELPYRFAEGALEDGGEITLIGRPHREREPYSLGAPLDAPPHIVFEAGGDPLVIIDGPARWRIR